MWIGTGTIYAGRHARRHFLNITTTVAFGPRGALYGNKDDVILDLRFKEAGVFYLYYQRTTIRYFPFFDLFQVLSWSLHVLCDPIVIVLC